MDWEKYIQKYWNYYTKLEDDCFNLSRYVEFLDINFPTCSNEIISQLLNIGSEFDSFCKIVCEIDKQRPKISDYANSLLDKVPNLTDIKIHMIGTSLNLYPFKLWERQNSSKLFWWEAYNEVKHNREENYEKGNLKNLLNALAALYFLEMYFVREIAQKSNLKNAIDVPITASKLFSIIRWRTNFYTIGYNTYTDYEPEYNCEL